MWHKARASSNPLLHIWSYEIVTNDSARDISRGLLALTPPFIRIQDTLIARQENVFSEPRVLEALRDGYRAFTMVTF